MYNLPDEVVRKIYMYDNTYRLKFNIVIEEIDVKENNKAAVMKITKEDIILFITILLIGLYIFIDERLKNI